MGNANKEESNKLTIKGVVTNDEPGVIYLSGGNCNMYDGVKICDNTSNNYYGSGGTISNNNATDGVDGGISILGTRSDGYGTATMPSTFVMAGGNIVDNTAANYGGRISGNRVSGKTSVEYQSNVGGPAGGGLSVFAVRNIPVNIGNVSICNNIVSDGKDNGIGGGIAEGYYTNVVMDSTNIYENKAQKNGGGVAAIYNKEQKGCFKCNEEDT